MTGICEHVIEIAAPRKRVWRALTDERELTCWFAEHAEVSLVDARYDFWGRLTPGAPERDEGRHRVLEVEPERWLRFSWRYLGADTTVDITLEDDTRVRVVHERLPDRDDGAEHHPRHLWVFALSQLRAYLEMGRSGPRFDYLWPHVGGFHIEADVNAPPEDVWPLVLAGWHNPQFRRPARDDSEEWVWDVGIEVGMKILDIEEPNRLSLAWNDPRPTVQTTMLQGSEGRTRITIVHTGFDAEEDVQGMAEGFFTGLVALTWWAETAGKWVPTSTRESEFPNVGTVLGVRVLQST